MAIRPYNEVKKKCNEAYIKNNDLVQLKITLPREKKTYYADYVMRSDQSMTQFIIAAIEEKIAREQDQ